MSPELAQLLILAIRLGREALAQARLADLSTLPPELREKLMVEMDRAVGRAKELR